MRLAVRNRFCVLVAAALAVACDTSAITHESAAGRITLAIPWALSGHHASLASQTDSGGGRNNSDGDDVANVRVRISIVGRGGTLLDRNFNPDEFCDDENGTVSADTTTACILPVPFTYPGGSERATFEVVVDAIGPGGVLAYKIGPAQFQLNADGSTATVTAQAVYVGPGSDATGVTMTPRVLSLTVGNIGSVACSPTRGGAATSTFAPMVVYSANPSVADAFFTNSGGTTSATGIQVFANGLGSTRIFCQLDFGSHAQDAIDVTVAGAGVGLSMLLVSGGNQTGNVNTTLPTPIVIKVLNAAGQPVAGVGVGLGFGNGSGSAAPTFGITDGSGLFTTSWTLGPLVGTQFLFAGFSAGSGPALTVTATGR